MPVSQRGGVLYMKRKNPKQHKHSNEYELKWSSFFLLLFFLCFSFLISRSHSFFLILCCCFFPRLFCLDDVVITFTKCICVSLPLYVYIYVGVCLFVFPIAFSYDLFSFDWRLFRFFCHFQAIFGRIEWI